MREKKYTPGPWITPNVAGSIWVTTEDKIGICRINSTLPRAKTVKANTNLISATPQLLEALENLLYAVTDIRGVEIEELYAPVECKNARAAIAQAYGESEES